MLTTWTEADFLEMSWHDNAVHAVRIIEGAHGSGELVLDLDYIVEWIGTPNPPWQFRIAPAELRFHQTTHLRIAIDYAASSAALTPFAIDTIRREPTPFTQEFGIHRWVIDLAWPTRELSFHSPRFTQRLLAEPVVCNGQSLSAEERGRLTS